MIFVCIKLNITESLLHFEFDIAEAAPVSYLPSLRNDGISGVTYIIISVFPFSFGIQTSHAESPFQTDVMLIIKSLLLALESGKTESIAIR